MFTSYSIGNCQSACVVCSTADEGRAVGSQPLKITYWAVRPTYSAQGGGGNCERGAGRCSAAQSEFDAPRKIFQPKSLIFRLKDFAGMEKVRFLALISYFRLLFIAEKKQKRLSGQALIAVFSVRE